MAIEDRNLLAGTRLVANYKKRRYVCTVEAGEGGEGIAFVLEDGSRHKSPSSAGSAVMGGTACNGWRFWTVEGEEPRAEAKPDAKANGTKAAKPKKLLYRVPNQQGVAEGKRKYWCNACMKSFVVDGDETPAACPEGHRADDPELTAPAGVAEVEATPEGESA
jgi:hypothetical protein